MVSRKKIEEIRGGMTRKISDKGRCGNIKVDESRCDECVKNKEVEVVIKRRMLAMKGKGRISTRTLR